jgi:hypothetical protein
MWIRNRIVSNSKFKKSGRVGERVESESIKPIKCGQALLQQGGYATIEDATPLLFYSLMR